jgi:hypothetical protein
VGERKDYFAISEFLSGNFMEGAATDAQHLEFFEYTIHLFATEHGRQFNWIALQMTGL